MRGSRLRQHPERPPGIAEWEDLLVRVELGPRVIRIAVDTAPPDAVDAAVDERGWTVAAHVAHLADREEQAAVWIAAMRDGAPVPDSGDRLPPPAGEPTLDDSLRRFASLRARNFAMAQRRGIEVWEWRASHAEQGEATAYQLFQALASHDARHLARIRSAVRGSA